MKVAYVSNFALEDSSGGWNGINANLFNALKDHINTTYLGNINPPPIPTEQFWSRIQKLCRINRNYFFFSESRLRKIAFQLEEVLKDEDAIFYFGSTPWIKHNANLPYVTYLDICFPKYIELYLKDEIFNKKDIMRIAEQEKLFLNNAHHIFWGSQWALEEARVYYKKEFDNSTILSTAGNISVPLLGSSVMTERKLLFISLNFEKKGGYLAFEVFKTLQQKFSDLTFAIIGERPPPPVLNWPGVNYVGRLNKNVHEEKVVFERELKTAFFLIHPTEMDTMGAVIAEAGYYGVPAIAPENFGIPDLIHSGKTGIMVEKPLRSSDFVAHLEFFLTNIEVYEKMRKDVRDFMKTERTWEAMALKIGDVLKTIN